MTGQVVSLKTARAVLWHFGDENLGIDPGSFWNAQILAIARADDENRGLLATLFLEHVIAVVAVRDQPWGLDWLRGLVKDAEDARERALDFAFDIDADLGDLGRAADRVIGQIGSGQ